MKQIYGNLQQQEKIKQLLVSSSPPNPLMICGAQGLGKYSYIKSVLDEISSGSDILYPGLSVDDARESVDFSYSAPNFNNHKYIVINDAELLSFQAQDAYLKSCEESSDWSIFIFISNDPLHISPALLSRIREIIRWNTLSDDDMINFASSIGPINENIYHMCGGRPGIYKAIVENDSLLSFSADLTEFLSNSHTSPTIPNAILEAKKSDKNYRLMISRICFMIASKLTSNRDRVCSVLNFASTVFKYPSLDIESYWIKATLNT